MSYENNPPLNVLLWKFFFLIIFPIWAFNKLNEGFALLLL